jgi:hypothetical protein
MTLANVPPFAALARTRPDLTACKTAARAFRAGSRGFTHET